jgi:hypothetical protein
MRRDATSLSDAAGLRDVGDDAHNPRRERRPPLEAVETLQHAKPRLLDHLFRDRPAADIGSGHGEHRAVVAVDQDLEGALVTRSQPREELDLFGAGCSLLQWGVSHARPNLPAVARHVQGA